MIINHDKKFSYHFYKEFLKLTYTGKTCGMMLCGATSRLYSVARTHAFTLITS